jgi:Glycosyl transferase family 2
MKEKMQISIAMATYNGEAYIQEQLDSLANQTLLPKELIVCDDGSTDQTLEIVEQWSKTAAPFPVYIYRNEKRLGFADNFLQAARRCTGDLIAFCDQDDVWLAEKLQYCLTMFTNEPELMLLSHNAWVTDAKLCKIQLLSSYKTGIYGRGTFQTFVNPLLGFTQIFRKELVQDIPWDARPKAELTPGCLMAHDYWIPIVASSLGKVMISDRVLVSYRQHGKNTFGLGAEQKDKASQETRSALRSRLQSMTSRQIKDYQRFRGQYQACAGSLESISRRVSSVHTSHLLSTARTYRKIAGAFGAREALYAKNLGVGQKVRRLSKLVIQRAYIQPRRGGLGLKYFFRDLAYATMAQAVLGTESPQSPSPFTAKSSRSQGKGV